MELLLDVLGDLVKFPVEIIQLVLGKNFFYENAHPLVRATHGLIFLKQMTVSEFLALAEEMKKKVG